MIKNIQCEKCESTAISITDDGGKHGIQAHCLYCGNVWPCEWPKELDEAKQAKTTPPPEKDNE